MRDQPRDMIRNRSPERPAFDQLAEKHVHCDHLPAQLIQRIVARVTNVHRRYEHAFRSGLLRSVVLRKDVAEGIPSLLGTSEAAGNTGVFTVRAGGRAHL